MTKDYKFGIRVHVTATGLILERRGEEEEVEEEEEQMIEKEKSQ